MSKLQVIGDELHHDGELVAIMTENAAPTARERFLDALHPAPVKVGGILDGIEECAQAKARGGLLRMSDLSIIIAQLKKDQV